MQIPYSIMNRFFDMPQDKSIASATVFFEYKNIHCLIDVLRSPTKFFLIFTQKEKKEILFIMDFDILKENCFLISNQSYNNSLEISFNNFLEIKAKEIKENKSYTINNVSKMNFSQLRGLISRYKISPYSFINMNLNLTYDKTKLETLLGFKEEHENELITSYIEIEDTINSKNHELITYLNQNKLVIAILYSLPNLDSKELIYLPKYYFEFELINNTYKINKSYSEFSLEYINLNEILDKHKNSSKRYSNNLNQEFLKNKFDLSFDLYNNKN